MPAKKQQRNAFYFYMQELMPELKREGRPINGMADVVPIAHPRYKMLPEKEKARFEEMAKEYKRRMRGIDGDHHRLDNVGNIIAYRKDPQTEAEKRRQRERKRVEVWPEGQGVVDLKFFLIDFQTLCKTEEEEWLPCEVGLVEYSMKDGITNTYHAFIEPGAIPTGYRFECMSNSESTHKIPVQGFELADRDYSLMWTRLQNFINPDGAGEEYPPVYTLMSETKKVYTCLQWLHARARTGGKPNKLKKVYELEGLLCDLCNHVGQGLSLTAATDYLTTHAWDYEAKTRCKFHEDEDTIYCALGDCNRRVYALSDTLSSIYNFRLTDKHMPVRDDTVSFTVIKPENNPMEKQRMPSNQNRYNSPSRPGFGGTDYRYQKTQQIPNKNEENFEPDSKPTMRRPNAPAMASQVSATQPTPWARPPIVPQSPNVVPPWSIGSTAQVAQQQQPNQSPPPWALTQYPSMTGTGGIGRGIVQPPKFAGRQGPPAASGTPQPPQSWQQNESVRAPPGMQQAQGTVRPMWTAPSQPGMRGVAPWSAPFIPQQAGQSVQSAASDPQMAALQQQVSNMFPGRGRGRGMGVYNPGTGAPAAVRMPPGFS